MTRKLVFLALAAILSAGCAAKTSLNWDRAAKENFGAALTVPFFPQTKYNCGPASLAMVLNDSGVKVTPDKLTPAVYTPSKKGSLQPDMLSGARRYGRIPYIIKTSDELFDMLKHKKPVLVFMNLGLSIHPVWHYAVVTGYFPSENLIIMHSGIRENEPVKAATFEKMWARSGYWGFVLLKAGEIPENADPLRLLDSVSAYEAQGHKDAILTYDAAVSKWPDSQEAMFAYANALYGEGDYAGAIFWLLRITTLNPENADAWNNLANVLNETGNKEDAVKAAEKAVSIGGRNLEQYQETLKSIK